MFLSQVALVPVQAATPDELLAAAKAAQIKAAQLKAAQKRTAMLKSLATYDLLFQSAMNRASLMQVRQLGFLLYNHFELKRTEREVPSGVSSGTSSCLSDKEDTWNLWTQESGSLSKSTSSSSSSSPGSTSQTVNTSSGAFLLGVDYQLCRDVRAGLFSGYLPSYTTLSSGLGSATTQGLTYGGTLSYGKPQRGFYADGGYRFKTWVTL
jgi:hypothetical protein